MHTFYHFVISYMYQLLSNHFYYDLSTDTDFFSVLNIKLKPSSSILYLLFLIIMQTTYIRIFG